MCLSAYQCLLSSLEGFLKKSRDNARLCRDQVLSVGSRIIDDPDGPVLISLIWPDESE